MTVNQLLSGLQLLMVLACVVGQSTDSNEPTSDPTKNYFPREECSARNDIIFRGNNIYERAIAVNSPEECCQECEKRPQNCVAWEFHACCNDCWVYSSISEVRDCGGSGCIAGTLKSLPDDQKKIIDDFVFRPIERSFKTLESTCRQQDFYETVAAVLAACEEVKSLCDEANEKAEPIYISPIAETCQMQYDTNLYGSDYNNGFIELTLTPEECCMKCMEDRGCRAWTRTYSGQCWKKWQHDPTSARKISGDVAGVREHLEAICGEQVDGIRYSGESQEDPANTTEECCKSCTENQSCLFWSFFDSPETNTTMCRQLYSPFSLFEKIEGAVSAHMLTKPIECNGEEKKLATPREVARMHDIDCASILINGPQREKKRCKDKDQANEIFKSAIESFQASIE